MSQREMDPKSMPRHVAIIMDGNGRWAEKRGVDVTHGHEAGTRSVRVAIKAARDFGIKVLTLYAFSTENWRRPQSEVKALFAMMSKYIYLELDNMNSQDIRVVIMGRTDGLYEETIQDLAYCQEGTKNNKSMLLNVAVNYGARTEIADAARAIAADVKRNKLALDKIDEKKFAEYLYMPYLPDLDLLIRTSGEMRVSNFMLWQLSYAEFVPMPVLWPDFRRRHLRQAILTYQSRHRRFGARK